MKDYWNQNLDTDNLSRERVNASLEEQLAFARTPEFLWLQERMTDLSGKTLVELGGGLGMHTLLWARAGARVIVLDMAVERLKKMAQIAEEAGLRDRIVLIAGEAERLPLPAECVDAFFTKSVLIHTHLSEAAREIHRALRPGGKVGFIEPLNRNPLIRLYRRTFAPAIWRSITTYFDDASLATLAARFGMLQTRPFYLCSAWSFFWQYGLRRLGTFRRSLRCWMRLDRWLMRRFPRLKSWCWFTVIYTEKTKSGDGS